MSERVSLSDQNSLSQYSGGSGSRGEGSSRGGGWEDTASHHTMSVDSEGGGEGDSESDRSKWKSSDHDTSGLSHSEIQKLRKKGINPALYAEMKAARKGRGKWAGPLAGNSFLG